MSRISPTTRARRSLIASVTLAALIGVPLAALPTPTKAAFPGYNGKIAFQSNRDGNNEIYVMDADGSNPTNLTQNAASDGGPAWSPDGTKIAFHSDRDGNNEIYVMDADGTGLVRLTTNAASDERPNWSPDGSKLVFSTNRDGNNEIYVMNSDGTNPIRLTNHAASDVRPNWSPDGSKIAFASMRDNGVNPEIYVMDPDGGNQTRLTNNGTANDDRPVWSPDGSQLLFQSNQPGNNEIYVMDADGGNQTNLSAHGANDLGGFWSPDGTRIAFNSDRDGNYEIYVMNSDGTNPVRLTNDLGLDSSSEWQPIPNQAPVVTADTLTVPFNTADSAAVLANDTDEEALAGSNLSITVQPAHGSATVNAGAGTITYTPTTGYSGADALTYQICDSFLLDQKCATALLGITIQAAPDTTAPTKPTIASVGGVSTNGTSAVYSTSHRPTFSGTAEAGATITVLIESDPITLTTTADGDGNWSVTPDQDIPAGEHTVTITATDAAGNVSEALTFVLSITTGQIPVTGADTAWLRLCGLGLLTVGGGLSLARCRRRQTPISSVPSLFP